MRLLFALFAPFIMLLCGSPVLAQEGPWRVSETTGSVTIVNENESRTAREGLTLQAGDNIRTAARSSAILVRGREFVTVRQNSSIKIPEARRERSVFQIIQDYGSALFNIGRQPDPHFGVETPYMAAVVKGTIFTITVSEEGSVLQVTEGAVETSTLDGGASDLITPGVIAMISANDSLRLVVEGDVRQVIDSPARSSQAPASTPAPASSGTSSNAPAEQEAREPNTPAPSANVQRIETPITSAPADLAGLSNGFVTRTNTPTAAVRPVGNSTNRPPQVAALGRGRANGLGGFSDASVCLVGNCDAVQPNSGGNGNGNSGGNGNGNSGGNGNGNSGGNGNGNSGGNGNGNSGGNGNGNSGGNGNGNSGGNGNGNSGGNGNGNSGGNGNGNSGGNGNGNSGGNGNGNSGGNGNGNSGGNGNGNSGGNGNGNSGGNGNGNSGGNGNGNSGGNGNGNSGGNGNGNSGGNGNGNSGGNGNGNSGGNGNGNSGGNGNGNSGGNGNGNSGGNGNGRGPRP